MMEPVTSDAVPASVPAPASAGPAVLRPSRAAYLRAVKANLWIAIPLLVISLVRIGLNWWLPLVIVVIALSFGGVVLYFRNARVEYGDGSYAVHSMFGTRTVFQAAQAASVVTVTTLVTVGVQAPAPQLIVVAADGTKILRLRGQTWEVDQFAELANDLIAHGVANDAIREPITPIQLQQRYPGVVGWTEAHPIAFSLLLGLGILVVIVVFVVIAVGSTAASTAASTVA